MQGYKAASGIESQLLALVDMLGAGAGAASNPGKRTLAELEADQKLEMQQLLAAMGQGLAASQSMGVGSASAWGGAGTGPTGVIAGSSEGVPPETPVNWLSLTGPSSITASGMPATAPACVYVKGDPTFQNAHQLLGDLVGNIQTMVTFHHDPEWEKFPEVGQAIKYAGGAEECFCVATVESMHKWAVGIGTGWKTRESAAKVALAVALSAQPAAPVAPARLQFGGAGGMQFGGTQAKASISQCIAGEFQAQRGGGWDTPSWGESARKKPRMWDDNDKADIGCWYYKNGMCSNGDSCKFSHNVEPNRPAVAWISLAEGSQLGSHGFGFPRDAPVVTYSSELKALEFSDVILNEIVGSVTTEIQIHHNMDDFPQVTLAVSSTAAKADICIAVCKSASRWAVGVNSQKNCRERAAKLALSVALAPLTDQLPKLISSYPDFAICVQEALEPGSTQIGAGFSGVAPANKPQIPWVEPKQPIERDIAHRIRFEVSGTLLPIMEKMLPDGIAVATDGKKRPKLYGRVDAVLKCLLIDPDTEVEYHDDPNMDEFPQIAEAVRGIPTDEIVSMTLAVCPCYGAWGVGLGSNYANRHKAARVALATMLYLQACEVGGPPDLPDQAAFEHFVYDLLSPNMQKAVDQAWKLGLSCAQVLAGHHLTGLC